MTSVEFDHVSVAAFALTFLGGVVTGFNPCCFGMVPAIVGYLGGYGKPTLRKCAWLSGWFALGLATATALLGLAAVLVGGIFGQVHPAVRYALALVPIVMGLHLLGIVNLAMPGLQNWKPIRTGTLGAFLTGLLFSIVLLPCATPLLASILSYAAGHGGALYGSGLLFTYGAGMGVPLMLVGTSIGLMSSLKGVSRWWPVVNRVSGVILLGLGFFLLWRA